MALQMLASRKYVLGFVYSVTSGVLRLLHRATGGVLGLALSLLHRAASRLLDLSLSLFHCAAGGVFGLIRRLIQLLRSAFGQIFHFCLTFSWHTVA